MIDFDVITLFHAVKIELTELLSAIYFVCAL